MTLGRRASGWAVASLACTSGKRASGNVAPGTSIVCASWTARASGMAARTGCGSAAFVVIASCIALPEYQSGFWASA